MLSCSREMNLGSVLLGDNFECRVKGCRMCEVENVWRFERLLPKVRFVPDIKKNLISVGVLDYSRYAIMVENIKNKLSRDHWWFWK